MACIIVMSALPHKGIFGAIPPAFAGLLTVTGAAPVRRDKRPCQPTTRGESCPNAPLKKPQKP